MCTGLATQDVMDDSIREHRAPPVAPEARENTQGGKSTEQRNTNVVEADFSASLSPGKTRAAYTSVL